MGGRSGAAQNVCLMIPLVEKEGFTFIINQNMLNKFKTKFVHFTAYLINAVDISFKVKAQNPC